MERKILLLGDPKLYEVCRRAVIAADCSIFAQCQVGRGLAPTVFVAELAVKSAPSDEGAVTE